MYVVSGVVVLVLIIGFALYINHLKETHSSEIRKQKEELNIEHTKKLRDEVDKVYIKMRDEKNELILNEMQYFFSCNEDEAEHYCNILIDTACVKEFFSAKTYEERQTIFNQALEYYKNLPEHLKTGYDG